MTQYLINNPGVVIWGYMVVIPIAIAIPLLALFSLRKREIDELLRFLWAILILFVPILGSLVYFIVHPGEMELENDEGVND